MSSQDDRVREMRDLVASMPADVADHFGLDRIPFDQAGKPLADMLRLDGCRALVTGGGGADLGSAICRGLAAQGAKVGVLDIDGARAEAVAKELDVQHGVDTMALTA